MPRGFGPKGIFSDVPKIEGRIAVIDCVTGCGNRVAVKVNKGGHIMAFCPTVGGCGNQLRSQTSQSGAYILKKVKAGNWEKGAKSACVEALKSVGIDLYKSAVSEHVDEPKKRLNEHIETDVNSNVVPPKKAKKKGFLETVFSDEDE